MTVDKRLQRKIDKHLEDEARWLQKVLFALGKARETREKYAETTGDEHNPLISLDDGTKVPLDKLETIIQTRVEDLMAALGRGIYGLKS